MAGMNEQERKALEDFVAREIGAAAAFVKHEEAEFIEHNSWKNVTGHCLIEAARACVFGDLLGFDHELKKDFALAALLHDGHKKQEIEAIQEEMRRGGSGRAASMSATDVYLKELSAKSVPQRVIQFIGFAGGMPEALFAAKDILDQGTATSEGLAALLIHYIDAYTRNDEWTEQAAENQNDLDRRAEKNKKNQNYTKINDEITDILRSHPFFSGRNGFEAMVVIGREIEKKLSPLISMRLGVPIEPVKIPETIDGLLRTQTTVLA